MDVEFISSGYGRLVALKAPANSKKLLTLFQKWIFDFHIALDDGRPIPANCIDLFGAISRQDSINFKEVQPRAPRSSLGAFILYLAKWIPLSTGVVAGGVVRYSDRLRIDITKSKIQSVEWAVDQSFKSEFLSEVESMLVPKTFECFASAIPDIFFCKIKNNANLLPQKYIGSPDFINHSDYIKILFVDNPVEFIGFCHGGFFGEFLGNMSENFEVNFSDEYFYWGLGSKNIRQNRFSTVPPSGKTAIKVCWIGKITPNCYIKNWFEGYDIIFNEASENLYINGIHISQEAPITFLRHPREPKSVVDFDKVKIFSSLSQEEINDSVFVIDSPGSTFMYMAMYQNLPFVLIFNRSWRRYFSTRYRDFLDFLEGEGLVLYWDDEHKISDYFSKLNRGMVYPADLFQKCRDWLEDV